MNDGHAIRPWQKINLDFYGPLQSGEYLLVFIERYSRYPEVEIVRLTKAASVIPCLDKIFSVKGLPHQVISNNGNPFNSTEFTRYMDTLRIQFDTTTPTWLQGNAEVERFMQPLGKVIQTAHGENKVWQQELYQFLLRYRSTDHSRTQVPPAELLFIRKWLTSTNRHRPKIRKEGNITSNMQTEKRHTEPSNINVGDTVLVRQGKQNKLTTKFNQTPYTVNKQEMIKSNHKEQKKPRKKRFTLQKNSKARTVRLRHWRWHSNSTLTY